MAFRLQLSLASAEDAVSDAKNNLLASCRAAEHAATAAASLPRFMAIGTNKQIVDAVNGTMNGAREALILALTVMEAIINFIIDTYRSTFLCFLELVVRGGLAILISAVQEVPLFLPSVFTAIFIPNSFSNLFRARWAAFAPRSRMTWRVRTRRSLVLSAVSTRSSLPPRTSTCLSSASLASIR